MNEQIVSFRRADRPEAVCLVMDGEIDLAGKNVFDDAIATLVDDANSPAVVDLTRVTFFNSTGIRVLITAQEAAADRDVQLVIEPSPAVRHVLEITGLTQTFELRDPA